MGFKVIPAKCPICGRDFLAQSYQIRLAQSKGRSPACSRSCEQERRHQASRDKKWQAQQSKVLNASQKPN
jgi:hypothetical protein